MPSHPIPWGLKRLTSAFPILLELEDRQYKTSLIVVDDRHHFEGRRVGRVLMKASWVYEGIRVGDRVLIRGSSGKTRDTEDKVMDEKYRFVRESDVEAVLAEDVEVETYARH